MARVLVTGGSGMVGRNLLELLKASHHEVLAPSSSELDLMAHGATFAWLKKHRPDVIIHSAGHVGGIQANIREPVAFLARNLSMGQNLLLGAREAGVDTVLNLGSSCMYPKNSPNALREEDVLTGALEPTNEGYALAKCVAARMCSYMRSEDPSLQYKTLIPCNLYGKYDKFDPKVSHLVPAIIRKLHVARLTGQRHVEIWGDGSARREFMYAGDLADAIVFFLERASELPGDMNVGLGSDLSVLEYYQAAADVIGFDGSFVFDTTKPVGMMRKLLDVSRQKNLGWSAPTSLREGIQKAYEYFLTLDDANDLSAG
ncbi:GDP-L-fucose synthase [Agrobacterium sp. AGB01]|uniref:GDP-L-fucose synthase family protein n=1 Tax=Agrobacterium sp. AGB01 TaxID=2769302 RepID=UPI00177E7BA1|nr:GDP-L-fucose synthase [Agrobacterium sp. AGB01]MBD9388309.1 GDP-L-fucose synthase [Agrobacterium sp. AGB01]